VPNAPRWAPNGPGSRSRSRCKSFLRKSPIEDLHHAVGQYVVYRAVMWRTNPGREVFLAVPQVVYNDGIFGELLGQIVTADAGIKLLVFNPATRRVVRWRS
jgi:XisH protein